jgi:uncharacterized membrane protein
MSTLLRALTVSAAVGAGIVAGVLFAFSTFVMHALDEQPASSSIATMQAINRGAPNPMFMVALLGTVVLAVVLGVVGAVGNQPGGGWLVGGAALYLLGFAVTAIYHIPHNDGLVPADPSSLDADAVWSSFSGAWTVWNHLRTALSIGAVIAFCLAL